LEGFAPKRTRLSTTRKAQHEKRTTMERFAKFKVSDEILSAFLIEVKKQDLTAKAVPSKSDETIYLVTVAYESGDDYLIEELEEILEELEQEIDEDDE
jgi:hypothetical protein